LIFICCHRLVARTFVKHLDIQVVGDKIVFPADKWAAKRLLLFLNEEPFRSGITDKLYETNSKRVVD
jgi:hypothetical protein